MMPANIGIDQEWLKDFIDKRLVELGFIKCEHDPAGDYHVCVEKCKKCGVIVE